MERTKEWFLKNWGNLFSFFGLLAALYIGFFYVPSYVIDASTEKQRTIHIDLIQSTKELVYNDSITDINEIKTLIQGKEVKFGIKYEYTIDELLLQTQEEFMEHKFLPLEKRRELIKKIDSIKRDTSQNTGQSNQPKKAESNKVVIISWLSRILSVLAVLIGLISIIFKFRKEKEKTEEIKNQIESETITAAYFNKESGYKYEEGIITVIKGKLNIIGNQLNIKNDNFIDFKFEYNNLKNYVFIKYLSKSKIGLGSIKAFLKELIGRKGNAILVYNTDLTAMVKKEIELFRSENPKINLILIKAINSADFESQFDKELLTKKPKA